jgi:hypothetical protein
MTKSFPSSLALSRWTGNGAPLERCEVEQPLKKVQSIHSSA